MVHVLILSILSMLLLSGGCGSDEPPPSGSESMAGSAEAPLPESTDGDQDSEPGHYIGDDSTPGEDGASGSDGDAETSGDSDPDQELPEDESDSEDAEMGEDSDSPQEPSSEDESDPAEPEWSCTSTAVTNPYASEKLGAAFCIGLRFKDEFGCTHSMDSNTTFCEAPPYAYLVVWEGNSYGNAYNWDTEDFVAYVTQGESGAFEIYYSDGVVAFCTINGDISRFCRSGP